MLAVFANPKGTETLRLDEEQRVMRECLERGPARQTVRLDVRTAATIDDLARALLGAPYDIVHISGHGSGKGLLLEESSGRPVVPPPAALAQLFSAHVPPLRCVILSSCYSLTQGILMALGVPFTVATEQSLSDEAAIEFTRGFFDAVAAGRDIEFAYNEGIRRCLLKSHDPLRLPRMLRQGEVLEWPRSSLPIPLDDGTVVYPRDIVAEGYCTCERNTCVDTNRKVYTYFTKRQSRWVRTTGLFWRCYDEVIRCPRCKRKHKRGHVGRRGRCLRPYVHQVLQRD